MQTPTVPSVLAQAEGKMFVHALWFSEARGQLAARRARFQRAQHALGIASYELIEPRQKRLANAILRRLRGTAAPPDAVEIIHLHPGAPCLSDVRDRWHATARCSLDSLDAERSCLIAGTPVRRLQGTRKSLRILWLGRGLTHLSEDAFASHYLTVHGPLVAGHAALIGLVGYTQLRDSQDDDRTQLLAAGLGRALPPTFAELTLGLTPDLTLNLPKTRRAMDEIAEDERRHIDFSRSIILLA